MKCVFVFVLLLVTLPVAYAQAHGKVGMYPYSVFDVKPLSVGTPVWVNHGDTECAYSGKYPSASDQCFGEYRKAKIVKIFRMNRRYVYCVEIEPFDSKDGVGFEWGASFDSLYEAYNLPEEFRKYSGYFLLLNW